ncbi:LD-carboxypeptidase [Deltaproteobacteria bacterium TL4]
MHILPALKPGDSVALTAPSSHQPKAAEGYVEAATKVLESWGLNVILQPGYDQKHFYLAGTDQHRAQQFQNLYLNEQIKAIFVTRGGYGASRMIPHLDPNLLADHHKIMVGSSDFTSLLVFMQSVCDQIVYHGPCLATDQFLNSPLKEQTRDSLKQWLFDPTYNPSLPLEALTRGEATGVLTGGCLSLIVTSIGTPFEIETNDRILFLEDVNESPYRLDRMLIHLKNAGKLGSLKGLVFGKMEGCVPSDLLWEVIQDIFQGVPYPIGIGLPSGHGDLGLTLALGKTVRLNTNDGTLDFIAE